jgi:tRNA A-37 threonylcarbamoyl transferase component Bud32/membrane-associated phospholipid phosphatase
VLAVPAAPGVYVNVGPAQRAPAWVPVLPAGRRRRPSGAPPPLPRHIERSGLTWLGIALVAAGGAVAVFAGGLSRWAVDVTVIDDAITRRVAGLSVPGFTAAARVIAEAGAAPVAVIAGYLLLLALIVFRRFRQLLVLVVSYEVLTLLTTAFLLAVHRPLPFGVLVQFRWAGFSMPSVEIEKVCAVLTGALYTLVPVGRWRRRGGWAAAAIVAVIGLSRMRLGVDAPTDVVLGAVLGVTVPLLGLRLFAPEESFPVVYGGAHGAHLDLGGARGEAIRCALKDQMDIEVTSVEPFGLAGSGGSSPMRLRRAGQPGGYLFGKLYARSHVRADRWYKLGRQLLYGRLEDEQSFRGVRRLVQQEDYALRLCQAAGLPSPEPYGFVELTPDREYLLLTEFFAGSVELGDADVDDAVIDEGLLIVRRMWDAGLAHRDIKPANLLVRDGHLLLIDVAFAEVRPTPWRQAVDLANMMLCLALRSSAERVYQRGLQYFTVTEISEAFAAARGIARPSQLRHAIRADGRDLPEELLQLLPQRPAPVRVQRWSTRRVGSSAAVLVTAFLLVITVANVLINTATPAAALLVSTMNCHSLQPLLAEAQSVPTASEVVCIRLLPPGWTLSRVQALRGTSVITLDNDRAGGDTLQLTLTGRCAAARAAAVRAPGPGIRRLRAVSGARFAATWYDTFPGGCVQIALRPAAQQAAVDQGLAAQVPAIIGYISRVALRHDLAHRSAGRLQLNQGQAAAQPATRPRSAHGSASFPRWCRVRYVLAGRVDQVGPGLRAADLDRAPAELGVEAPGIKVLRADAEVA